MGSVGSDCVRFRCPQLGNGGWIIGQPRDLISALVAIDQVAVMIRANDETWGANSAIDGNRTTAWSSNSDGDLHRDQFRRQGRSRCCGGLDAHNERRNNTEQLRSLPLHSPPTTARSLVPLTSTTLTSLRALRSTPPRPHSVWMSWTTAAVTRVWLSSTPTGPWSRTDLTTRKRFAPQIKTWVARTRAAKRRRGCIAPPAKNKSSNALYLRGARLRDRDPARRLIYGDESPRLTIGR